MNYTLVNSATAIYKEKRSEFIGFAEPIKLTQDVNSFIKILKSKYPSARHICWGYRIYSNGHIIENSTDSGEPSGSAGLPILNVLNRNNLVNIGIFIVRFFGGVKLGKQGLIFAYRTISEKVIAEGGLVKWIPQATYQVKAPLEYFGKITHILHQNNARIVSDLSTDELSLLIQIPVSDYKNFSAAFDEITQNSGVIKKQSEHDQTKEVRK